MVARNCDGQMPAHGQFTVEDNELLGMAHRLHDEAQKAIGVQAFHEALEAVWVVVRAANGYVDRQAPWALRKDNPARMGAVLYVVAEALRHVAIVLSPFMPQAMGRMLDQLGVAANARDFAALGPAHALKSGTALPAPQGVFPRYVEADASAAAR